MAFDWRSRLGPRLVSLEDAVGRVQSDQTVAVAPFTCSPVTLCRGLIERGRKGDLENARIDHLASTVCWTEPELRDVFRLRDNYATPANREACHEGASDYLPIGLCRACELPDGVDPSPDVFLVPVSPPDEHGICSFGAGVWMSPTLVEGAKLVIAEVQQDFIRTGGENFVAVNNAMVVDLTGQVSAEAFDHRPFTGVGGQTVFMLAGAYSPNGKSVSVLPSSSVPSSGDGMRVTRIVPTLAPGTPVTVPRTYVDFVVTEFGIAELRGRTVQERARALCDVAHPEFRDELLVRARELYCA